MPRPDDAEALSSESDTTQALRGVAENEEKPIARFFRKAMKNIALVILVLTAIGFTVIVVLFEPERFWTESTRWGFLALILVLIVVTAVVEKLHLQPKIFPAFGTISVVVAFGSIFLWLPYAHDQIGPVSVQREFFATVGQVLPVLLLATIVDIRESTQVSATQSTSYLLVIATGEFWALLALGFDLTNEPFPYAVVCAALTGALLGLAIALYGRHHTGTRTAGA